MTTANTTLWIERENVKALKVYGDTIKAALDAKAREAKTLRAECERLRAETNAERRGQS